MTGTRMYGIGDGVDEEHMSMPTVAPLIKLHAPGRLRHVTDIRSHQTHNFPKHNYSHTKRCFGRNIPVENHQRVSHSGKSMSNMHAPEP